MKYIFTLQLFFFYGLSLLANNVSVTNVSQSGNTISFDISWENSWKTGGTHKDAVWIFIKQQPNGGPSWQHVNISSVQSVVGYTNVVPSDQTGFIFERLFNRKITNE